MKILASSLFRLPLFASLPLAAILFAGCGEEKFATKNSINSSATNSAGNTAGAQVIETPGTPAKVVEPPSTPGKYGGTITSSTISDPKSFNLWVSGETSTSAVVGPLYEALISQNPYTLEWEDALSELPKVSADGLTWTFQIKPDLKWSDDKPITADDVIFTFDVLYDPKVETLARESLMLDVPDPKTGKTTRQPIKYRKVDPRTIEFKFPMQWATARNVLTNGIAPRHKLEAAYKAGKFNSTWGVNTPVSELVSSGPWVISEYRSGQRIVYKRNPNYWKKDGQGRSLPYLDQRVLVMVRNTTTGTIKFKAGETDTLGIQHSDYPNIKAGEKAGNYTVQNLGPTWGFEYLGFNMNPNAPIDKEKIKLFSDVRFRQACSYAMNRPRLIRDVYRGLAQPQWSPLTPANTLFYNPNVPKYEYDPAKAKQLLAEAGLKDLNGDGLLELNGKPFSFNILTNGANETRKSLCVLLTKDLKNVGLNAIFTPVDFNALIARLDASYNWEATILGFTGGPEPTEGSNIWRSSGISHQWWPKQKKPATKWEAEIDDIFAKGARILDEAERKKMFERWQTIAGEQVPFIYTVTPDALSAVRNRFGNLKPNSLGGLLWNIEEIYDLKATRDTP